MNTTIEPTVPAPQWAVVELMGHVRYGGLVSKDNQLGTALLRVDVPQQDASFVTQIINPASIYRITFCEELIARAAAANGQPKPIEPWEMRHLLPAPATSSPHTCGGCDGPADALFRCSACGTMVGACCLGQDSEAGEVLCTACF